MPLNIRRILVPVDFSLDSLEATRYALELARQYSATVDVLYVWEPPALIAPEVPMAGPGWVPPDVSEQIREAAQYQLDAFVRKLDAQGTTVHPRLVVGTPAAVILELAEGEKFDFIVMGTHGRTGLSRLFLGSVTQKVVSRSPCPVLTLRAEAAKPRAT